MAQASSPCLIVAVLVVTLYRTMAADHCEITPLERFTCHPELSPTQAKCEERGCCWRSSDVAGAPLCYFPTDFPSYNVTQRTNTTLGLQLDLQKQGTIDYPRDIKQLKVDIMYETNTRLRVKMTDATADRWEVPLATVPRVDEAATDPVYTVTVSDVDEPFQLTVNRKNADGMKPLFQTDGAAPLMYSDQFMQLSYKLPSTYLYGIGEHQQDLMLSFNWTKQTIFNADQPPLEDLDLYGSHPFYLIMEESGLCSGFFLLNSNAMDVTLQPTPAITWRVIGGILDFYIFVGQTPAEVMAEFTNVIGRTFMPPYWSLGFHICRYGYKSVNDTMRVVDAVRDARVPHDIQWTDIDYAIGRRDFTTDVERFGDQAGMVKEFHDRGMKYIIITDPGISSDQPAGSYRPYDLGIEMDIFIKNASGQPIVGQVWPGATVFPDFSNPLTQVYWSDLIAGYTESIKVDGLWVDMNEQANFVNGSQEGCPADSEYDNPPYLPVVVGKGPLYFRTLCMSAIQNLSVAYNLHNMYGSMMTEMTSVALKEVMDGRRPFVISRATFSGQGHWGGHWTGDNYARFHDLYRSISAIVTLGMAGMPMIGADICGFNWATTYELCLRWYQLGAFYPFSRSHNSNDIPQDQDPTAFNETFSDVVRSSLELRYSLLPLMYTLFYTSHMTGAPVARGMFYEFPEDKGSYPIDTQFLWGSEILIVPVYTESSTSVDAYLPPGTVWYNITSGVQYLGQGTTVEIDAPMDTVNVLVQGGAIVPMQEPALTTTESRLNDFSLLVAMGMDGVATGHLYWDDGDSYLYEDGTYNLIQFSAANNSLSSNVVESGYVSSMLLSDVKMYGVQSEPSVVTLNGASQEFQYNSTYMVLNLDLSPKVNLTEPFVIQW